MQEKVTVVSKDEAERERGRELGRQLGQTLLDALGRIKQSEHPM
jgi:hypothetical protein